jgi:hypothetical protein
MLGNAMKLIKSARLAAALTLFSTGAMFQPALAVTTPADQDKLRIHTGLPKKASDSLFSYTAEWRIDDGELYRTTGLSFLNSAKVDPNASPAVITKKLVTAMKDGMIQLDPNWRGINLTQPQDQAELTIANKKGYSLTTVTVRDYSNQQLRFDVGDKNFNADGVQVAIDVVLAADVEYLDGFSSKRSPLASQGEIEVVIDGSKPVQVKTDGKTTKQIEEELARQLAGAKLSEFPLYPNLSNSDTRNNKPFDNSEVQLLNLAAKSVSINVTDPAVGVLTKFKFKDDNHSVKVVEPRFMLAALGVGSGLLIGFYWFRNRKKSV